MSATPDLEISTPDSVEALDISLNVVTELFLRRTLVEDTITITRLAEEIGISSLIVSDVFGQLRNRKLLDVKTMQGNDYVFSLTELGHEFAKESLVKCQYSGVAPVALDSYVAAVKLQKSGLKVDRKSMAIAMADLVVAPEMLDELGPAFNSQHSIFFYGPAGTGKTSLAERLIRLFDDWIVVPRAVLADGQYMVIFDPTIHEAISPQPEGLDLAGWPASARWSPSAASWKRLPSSCSTTPWDSVYTAPLHVKANNGMMLIDDFGRQMMTPQQLLNRWIYPLSKRVDYLSLSNGTKIGLPFELMVASRPTWLRVIWAMKRSFVASRTRCTWGRSRPRCSTGFSCWRRTRSRWR